MKVEQVFGGRRGRHRQAGEPRKQEVKCSEKRDNDEYKRKANEKCTKTAKE